MDTTILTTEQKVFIINQKIDSLRFSISYYQNGYFPELRDTTGSTQKEHLEMAKDRFNSFMVDIKDYNKTKRFDLLTDIISESDILNALRLYAVKQKEQAEDFKENIYIVGRCLRECIKAIQVLKQIKPILNQYTNKYLASRKIISIN